ncbi:hypothetical protein Ade02nite_31500 [Paractinoplanes deccanensis]|uniref:NACHT domain-containing protein n=1 Tax=Paractinoplanes deccanensis TaxID=113561 RepID=A0ABQ3Y3D8_9ACTN|nr:NACHT domain-containing protein [Actinoplanes deccanensis]GID74509.1 hypothetical protein Ade02nite_31500 [Actinoplanes deccanensis]
MLRWWRRHAGWFAAGGLALTVLGSLALLVAGSDAPLETGDQVASIVGGTTALLGLPVSVASLVVATRQQASPPAGPLDRLAEAVDRQWTREGTARGLFTSGPLDVRWRSTERAVAPAPGEVVPSPAGRVTRLRLHGDAATIASAFRRLPRRQLVIIGAPGAGKTSLAVRLVRDLARDRRAGDPVPVLLPLAGWRPSDDFDPWLVRGLVAAYPFLRDEARDLVDRGSVIPVLDGLDEIPASLRVRAVERLTATIGERPLVVTCRAREYADTIGTSGTPLAAAAVVELDPVAAAQVARYLPAGQIDGERRWQPVLSRLAAEPDGPLATTLSTPLMSSLARTAYTSPTTDPGDLLRFPDGAALTTHLLASYLPAVYRGPRPYTAAQAERWLRYLARLLTDRNATGIAWWLLDRPDEGTLLTPSPRPTRLGFRPLSVLVTLTIATVATPVVLPLVQLINGRPVGSPAQALAAGVVYGAGLGLCFASILGFRTPLSDDEITDTRTSLRDDRRVTLWAAVAPGAVAALLSGLAFGPPAALVFGPVIGLVTAFLYLYFSGWARWPAFVRYRLARALRRQLPLRLVTFLEDAYGRGVLRKAGAVYEFRHSTLQRYLTSSKIP